MSYRPVAVFLTATTTFILAFAFGPRPLSFAAAMALPLLPLVPLAWLAYLGRRAVGFRALAAGWAILLVVVAAFVTWAVCHAAAVRPELLAADAPKSDAPFRPGMARVLFHTSLALLAAPVVAVVAFTRPVRRFVARFTPLDENSFVHATALAVAAALTVIGFAPLVTFGEPPILLLIRHQQNTAAADTLAEATHPRYMLVWLAALIPTALTAVGWPIARTAAESAGRTGMVRPPAWQVVAAVAGGVALVGGVGVLKLGITAVWQFFHWPTTDAVAVEHLFRAAMTLSGAVMVGVAAGLGEELAVRGVLQPRLGIFVSNLLFTALHAFQYQADALTVVFLLGCGLGWVRKVCSTTVSAIVHGVYDATLLGLAAYGVRLLGER